MTPERWQRVKQLFEAAAELDPSARPEFLTRACADDDEVRQEVESLLSVHDLDSGFMNTPVGTLLPDETPLLKPGQHFGNYEQIALLGKGGMAQVYAAVDSRLERKIALKLLPSSLMHATERVRRFEQEARAASALNHPNIVTIHEIGEVDFLRFIATEFVDGETLRERLAKRAISIDEVLTIGCQIASALQAAHEAGIVHRDIKPENIMLRRDGIVKVLDFGLAKLDPEQLEFQSEALPKGMVQTNPGVVMGTIGYMSPEQARGASIDARTDIWSLGVVIYEMVSGRAPFVGETTSHIIVSIFEHEPAPLSMNSEVPDELQRIVTKCLTKTRDYRYPDVGNLFADLKSLKQRLEVDAAIEGGAEPHKPGDGAITKLYSAVATDGKPLAHIGPRVVHLAKSLKVNTRAWVFVTALVVASLVGYVAYRRYELRSRGSSVRSIAVIPFENQTQNPDSDYLSDGISESLINRLSQLPGVKVSARSSSFRYKAQAVDLQEAADALGVEAILTGYITQRGDNIVISVELINPRDKSQIWGEQYNRKISDLLVVQSDISSEIIQRLRLHLSPDEHQQLAKRDTVNLQAYGLFLKGRFCWSKGGTANRKKAVELYQQAIALDPTYALAYAEMSSSYDTLITNNELNPKEFAPKAVAAAQKALELDENLPEAHIAMARARMSAWDWADAERELKRTIELNPNLVTAHRTYATYLVVHGKREEAVAQFNHVRELDPLSLSASQAVLIGLSIFRQNDQALEVARKILETNKENPNLHLRVGEFYARLGRYREAIGSYLEAIKLGDDSPDAQTLLAEAYAGSGRTDEARAILQRYESGSEYCSPVGLATIHLALGEVDKAFTSLEAAYAARDQQLIWLRGAWEFDRLHSDPRFQDLVRRVGLSS